MALSHLRTFRLVLHHSSRPNKVDAKADGNAAVLMGRDFQGAIVLFDCSRFSAFDLSEKWSPIVG